jgi:hypothetical protein
MALNIIRSLQDAPAVVSVILSMSATKLANNIPEGSHTDAYDAAMQVYKDYLSEIEMAEADIQEAIYYFEIIAEMAREAIQGDNARLETIQPVDRSLSVHGIGDYFLSVLIDLVKESKDEVTQAKYLGMLVVMGTLNGRAVETLKNMNQLLRDIIMTEFNLTTTQNLPAEMQEQALALEMRRVGEKENKLKLRTIIREYDKAVEHLKFRLKRGATVEENDAATEVVKNVVSTLNAIFGQIAPGKAKELLSGMRAVFLGGNNLLPNNLFASAYSTESFRTAASKRHPENKSVEDFTVYELIFFYLYVTNWGLPAATYNQIDKVTDQFAELSNKFALFFHLFANKIPNELKLLEELQEQTAVNITNFFNSQKNTTYAYLLTPDVYVRSQIENLAKDMYEVRRANPQATTIGEVLSVMLADEKRHRPYDLFLLMIFMTLVARGLQDTKFDKYHEFMVTIASLSSRAK